jgi:hypothetical protein
MRIITIQDVPTPYTAGKLLTVRIHKHYSPTQKKLENFLRTYQDDDIWHEVDEAIVAELNAMFDGFCTSQPTCAGILLGHKRHCRAV